MNMYADKQHYSRNSCQSFTGVSDIFQQHNVNLQVKLLLAGI